MGESSKIIRCPWRMQRLETSQRIWILRCLKDWKEDTDDEITQKVWKYQDFSTSITTRSHEKYWQHIWSTTLQPMLSWHKSDHREISGRGCKKYSGNPCCRFCPDEYRKQARILFLDSSFIWTNSLTFIRRCNVWKVPFWSAQCTLRLWPST